jgi:hypothetical protein
LLPSARLANIVETHVSNRPSVSCLHAGACCLREGGGASSPPACRRCPNFILFLSSTTSNPTCAVAARPSSGSFSLPSEWMMDGWMAHEGRSGAVHPIGLIRFGLDVGGGAPNVRTCTRVLPRVNVGILSTVGIPTERRHDDARSTTEKSEKVFMDVFASSTVPCHVSQYGVSVLTHLRSAFRTSSAPVPCLPASRNTRRRCYS